MDIVDVGTKAWHNNTLFTALVELTYSCNLDCHFCYNDVNIQGKPLTTEQYLEFLEDLQRMQVLNLVLSGGEPLAHPGFFTIGRRARELGFVIRIKSNGHALRKSVARRIKEEISPFGLDISLHGACAETHDKQTKVAGSFDQLMKNLCSMQEVGLRFQLNATLTKWNEHELEDMYAIAESFGAAININPSVTPKDNGDLQPLAISASAGAIYRALSKSTKPTQDQHPKQDTQPQQSNIISSDKICGSGSSTVVIDPVGNVLPCIEWRQPVGNLHQQSIREIWHHSSELEHVRQSAVAAKQKFGTEIAGFCMGLAIAHSGDPLTPYPQVVQLSELRKQIKNQ